MNLNEVLKTWRSLNHHMHLLDEPTLKTLLDMELDGQCRQEVLKRLHQRYTALRVARERLEIMSKARA